MIQKLKKIILETHLESERKIKNTMENFPHLAILPVTFFWDGIDDSWRRRTLGAVAEELGNPSFCGWKVGGSWIIIKLQGFY